MLGDPSTFSWAQAFSDRTGKTSITSILAATTVFGGMFIFIISSIAALFGIATATTICSYAVVVLTGGVGATTANKLIAGKPTVEDTVVDTESPDSKDASDVASPPNGPDTPDVTK